MGKTKLDRIYRFEISIKIQLFDASIGIKIPFFRVPVTFERSCFMLPVRYHELFESVCEFLKSLLFKINSPCISGVILITRFVNAQQLVARFVMTYKS